MPNAEHDPMIRHGRNPLYFRAIVRINVPTLPIDLVLAGLHWLLRSSSRGNDLPQSSETPPTLHVRSERADIPRHPDRRS